MTTNVSYILNGTNDLISYHTSIFDAENGLNPINNPTSYSSSTATIWIRVTKNPVSSVINCAVIIEQELKVNALPIANLPSNYYSCMIPNSNQAPFQLDTKNNEILNGQDPALFTVTYHLSQQEAKQGINLLPNSYLSASQTIWASVRNNTTNCRNTSPLNLIAEPFTIANTPLLSNTTKCDEDGLMMVLLFLIYPY
ncbi:MAG: hypothetical protein HC854_00860 [Flavobacterium sp.]|nr:hypothetical protein [Flavobacterium sp.]